MGKRKTKPKPRDVALLHGPTPDGEGARFVRLRDGALSAGEIRPAREGQPLNGGELVRLTPLSEQVPVCEVEVLHDAGTTERAAGPARVATERYRRNWGNVFGASTRRKAGARKRDLSLN